MYNPNNVKVGDRCILDEGFANSSIVIVNGISPGGIYCSVYSEDDPNVPNWNNVNTWEVMSYRLKPLK